MKDKLSTEPYKGVRDFYPEDARIMNFMFTRMRGVLEGFGYEEYNASPLEPAELYESKTSDEIVRDQTYTFIDRGDRKVTLRPEMTPTVARMVAGRRRELSFPLRWYSIPNVFRYERPQRGRLREHYQLNVDIFGVETLDADVEIITIASDILRSFGAGVLDFEIRVNSRKLINAAFEEAGFREDQVKSYLHLIDRTDKISTEEFAAEKATLLQGASDPEVLILSPTPGSRTEAAKNELEEVIARLHTSGITNARYDKSIARGFDYYTGIVFEVYDSNPANRRSIFGGGRYDNLTALFSDDAVPGVGFGMGDVTLKDFIETHELMPETRSSADLFLGIVDEDSKPYAEQLARRLRSEQARVAVYFGDKKVGDQIKIADKKRIPFFAAIGTDEATGKHVKIKNLSTGDELTLQEEAVATFLINARLP